MGFAFCQFQIVSQTRNTRCIQELHRQTRKLAPGTQSPSLQEVDNALTPLSPFHRYAPYFRVLVGDRRKLQSRKEAMAVLREVRSIMETRQRQSATPASFLPEENGAAADGVAATPVAAGGGSGRPLFTPQVVAGFPQHGDSGAGAGAAARAAPGVFPTPASRPRRSSGAGGAGSGAGDYRLMDHSGGGASFMVRSPENMSVAMSLGSDDSGDDVAGAVPLVDNSLDGADGAGAGSADGDSFSDILSP